MKKHANIPIRLAGKRNFFLLSVLMAVMFVMPSVSFAALGKTEIADLFSQAKSIFHQADRLAVKNPDKAKDLYLKSIMRFERIIKEGKIHNGKLYYNIANAYFRVKDIGRAILNYRRAMEYMPDDPNLRQNLNYAREKRLDKIEERQKTRIFKTLFFFHYDLSTKTRIIIFSSAFILLWLFAAIRLFIRKGFITWGIVISIIFSGLFAGSLTVEAVNIHSSHPGVIINSQIIARKGNSETYAPSFKKPLHAGTEFKLVEKRKKWYQIELPDSRRCWVPARGVELIR